MRVLVATTWKPNNRIALSAIRALGRHGADVDIGGTRFVGQAFHSRFTKRRIRYPHPDESMDGFIASLEEHITRNRYDVVLPVCDFIVKALSLNRERIGKSVRIPVPDYETLMKTRDKLTTLNMARELGIEMPATYHVSQGMRIEEIAGKMEYPCVLKLRQGLGSIGIMYPRSRDELLECYRNRPSTGNMIVVQEEPMIQEYIPGEIHDVGLLFNNGEPRAAMTQRRVKMYPVSGGVGIINETTDEPELKEQAIALLKAMKWHGPALVEFKIDTRDGKPKLMEVNGRYWGGLDLSVRAGVDFPTLTASMLTQGDIEPVFDYRVGLQYRWPIPYGLLYTVKAPKGWRSLWDFFGIRSNTVSDLWLTDPMPTLSEFTCFVGEVFTRRMRRLRGQGADERT